MVGGTLESRFADRVREFGLRRSQAATAEEAAALERDEIEYVLDTIPFIKEYSSTKELETPTPAAGQLSNFVNVTHKATKNNVLQRYLMHVEKQVDKTTVHAVQAHGEAASAHPPSVAEYFCDDCDAGMEFHSRESLLVCTKCGRCRAFNEMNVNNLTYEQEIHQGVVTYFAYKRLNHFCEWLNSLQAKVRLATPPQFFFCDAHPKRPRPWHCPPASAARSPCSSPWPCWVASSPW